MLREIGAPLLIKPIEETLQEFRKTLEAKIETVNRRIAEGANEHIKLKGHDEKRRWSLLDDWARWQRSTLLAFPMLSRRCGI